jgi:hypothetical protein
MELVLITVVWEYLRWRPSPSASEPLHFLLSLRPVRLGLQQS